MGGVQPAADNVVKNHILTFRLRFFSPAKVKVKKKEEEGVCYLEQLKIFTKMNDVIDINDDFFFTN